MPKNIHLDIAEEIVFQEEVNCEEEQPATYEEIEIIETLDDFYSCNHCNRKYKTLKALENHNRNEHDLNNQLVCPFAPACSSRFADEKKLRIHTNRHEAELSLRDDGNFYCRICEKLCATKDLLIAHISTHNQVFCCDFCGKRFSKFEFMKNHVVQHVFGRLKKNHKKVICELCSQWVQRDRMKRHVYQMHSDKKDFKCNECGKEFKYSNSLRDHQDIHQNNPRFKCDYCQKKFFNRTNWKNHVQRHTDPERFKCSICGERYGNLKSLSNHFTRVHNEQKEKLECSQCDKFYYTDTALKSHVRRVHTKSKREDSVDCSLCNFSTNSIKNLQRHLWRVHKIRQRNYRVVPQSEDGTNV